MTQPPLPHSLQLKMDEITAQPDRRHKMLKLLEFGKRLQPLPQTLKHDALLVPGCMVKVHLKAQLDGDRVLFSGDADSQLIKGMLALLLEGLNGLSPQEILQIHPDFIKETGLLQSVMPGRNNSFYNIFLAIQQLAQTLS